MEYVEDEQQKRVTENVCMFKLYDIQKLMSQIMAKRFDLILCKNILLLWI